MGIVKVIEILNQIVNKMIKENALHHLLKESYQIINFSKYH